MPESYNNYQIIRKDAKNCFVESLYDSFSINKAHFAFATYDVSKPAGQRQTNNIHIYINVDEFLELCRKLECGELRYIMEQKRKANDNTPVYETMGGTSAETLKKRGKPRADGKSISRIAKITVAAKGLFFTADSGAGETGPTGLIIPKFGNKPENHVSVLLNFESFGELMLLTKTHYQAWLAAKYVNSFADNSFGGELGQ